MKKYQIKYTKEAIGKQTLPTAKTATYTAPCLFEAVRMHERKYPFSDMTSVIEVK